MGAFLLYEAAKTLVTVDRPTIGGITILGQHVWQGWVMIAALAYSVVPPVILGRIKRPVARQLADKVLYTDADMNAADWQTGLAGIVGVLGLGMGWWWADAAAAGLISLSVLHDGLRALRTPFVELMDGRPRAVDSRDISAEARQIEERLAAEHPGQHVLLRETGRYMRALITPDPGRAQTSGSGEDRHWRLIETSATLEGTGQDPENARGT